VLSFNDDIQGTGSVALAGILNALKITKEEIKDLKFVIYGAGAGGIGIARRISSCIKSKYGLSDKQANNKIALLDSRGLIIDKKKVEEYKKPFMMNKTLYNKWEIEDENHITLIETINNFKPNVLIGASGKYGHFNNNVLEAMINNCEKPIIFPLSNPTSNSEASPKNIYKHTKGKAIVATGSPYDSFSYKGRYLSIGQGNNFFIFPGVGLGSIMSGGDYISDSVFTEAAYTLSRLTSEKLIKNGTLYPPFENIRTISANIALSTIKQISQEQNMPEYSLDQIKSRMWNPNYQKMIKIE
jgi:malic enzyme